MDTNVCGFGVDTTLQQMSDEQIASLLDQIGRNGEPAEGSLPHVRRTALLAEQARRAGM